MGAAAVLGVWLAWSIAAAPAFPSPCQAPLRVGYLDVDSPPMLFGQGSAFADPPGWQVQAVRDAAARVGCPLDEVRLPGQRLDAMLENGALDFSLYYGATRERLRYLHYPLDAAGQPDAAWAPLVGTLAFYALAGSPQAAPGAVWNGQVLVPGTRVGVVAQTTQAHLAGQRGWPLVYPITINNGLQMLRAGRFDLLLTSRETMRADWIGGRRGLVEVAPPVARLPYFVVASRSMWRRSSELTIAFWSEVCRATRRYAPDARPVDCGRPLAGSMAPGVDRGAVQMQR